MESAKRKKQKEKVLDFEAGKDKMTPVTRRTSLRNQGMYLGHKVSRKSSTSNSKSTKSELSPLCEDLHNLKTVDGDNTIEGNKEIVIVNGKTPSFCPDEDGNFQCGICCKNFHSVDLLSSHMGDHCNTDVFQCNLCNAVFSSTVSLSSHLDVHNDVVKLFKCGVCDAAFIENAALLEHLNSHYKSLPSLYKCSICSSLFCEISLLISHVLKEHPSLCTDYKCKLCDKHFTKESRLSIHMQTHTGESSYLSKCTICFSKVTNSSMDKHMATHEKECQKIIGAVSRTASPKEKVITKNKIKQNKKTRHAKTTKDIEVSNTENEVETIEKEEFHDYTEELADTIQVETMRKRRTGTPVKSKQTVSDKEGTQHGNHALNNSIKVEKVRRIRRRPVVKPKQGPHEKRPTPVIKNKEKLIATYKKTDPQSNIEVYDCDVCGQRLQECTSFLQHRSDHFFDEKFCINCVHCSQVFDSFENLYEHVGKNKCSGYKCEGCGESFALEPLLLTHQIKEHSNQFNTNKTMICTICQKAFENRTAYFRHASSHSEDKCIECKLCRHAFTTQETLYGHLRTSHSLIPSTRQLYKFNCDTCSTNFIKNEALTKHLEVAHNMNDDGVSRPVARIKTTRPKPKIKLNGHMLKRTGHWRSAEDDKNRRTCPICKRVFRKFKDVRRHIGTHTKPYLCSHCGRSFPYRYALDSHIKAFHSAENPWKCEICGKFFSSQRCLIVHERIHSGEKPHQCHICQKQFRQVANLSMHIKLHKPDKPFKCEFCDYRCCHQGYLKRHMSTHSTEKKHFCSICNKGFTEKPNLNHHLKRHLKIKNHVCAVCGHRFAERYYLNNHMRIHTKEKPFLCPVCNRAFTMRPNMVSHIKKTHPHYNYQPIKPSPHFKSNPSTDANKEKVNGDMNMVAFKQNYSNTAHVDNNVQISNHNSISVPALSTTSDSLPITTQVPTQLPLLPISTGTIPHSTYQPHISESDLTIGFKPDALSFSTLRDIVVHPQPMQTESQQPAMNESTIHCELTTEGAPAVFEQSIIQDSERHQHYVNLTDRFAPTQFDPHRGMSGQNFTQTPMSNQDYMYTYTTLHPDAFVQAQGFFSVPNQNNQNPQHPEQQKP